MRASVNRHFSDTSYEILGHNLGLNTSTLHNWDFTNPNSTNACSLRFKVLSTASSLTISWFYGGGLSPWTSPTVTPAGATEVFHGTTYNVFYVDFTVGQTWLSGPSGQVPPGVKFHVGVSFVETDPIVVKDTILYDCSMTVMPLQPRIFGYDTGSMDISGGDFMLRFFNPESDRPLLLRNLVVMQVPRMIDIETMLTGMEPMGRGGMPINVISTFNIQGDLEVMEVLDICVANLMDQRHVDRTYTAKDCEPGYYPPRDGTGAADVNEGEIVYCPEGTALSLFPSTYVYVIADVIDPFAIFWDPQREMYVTGPQETRIFYQFSGFVPDFNENGIDDLLDIRNGNAIDENSNGIPDEVENELIQAGTTVVNPRNWLR
jgi:hypothetical protein